MKGIIITLSCAALAASALAQQQSNDSSSTGPTQKVETQMSGPNHGVGMVNAFRPGESISITTSLESHPVKYVMGKNVVYASQNGASANPNDIRAGTKVSLEFGENNQVDRVIVLDQSGAK